MWGVGIVYMMNDGHSTLDVFSFGCLTVDIGYRSVGVLYTPQRLARRLYSGNKDFNADVRRHGVWILYMLGKGGARSSH